MKYLPLLIFLCSLITFQFLPAQAPDTSWTNVFGGDDTDEAFDIEQTTDGNYIIVGRTVSFGSGATDVWLLKVNANGDTLWTRTFGGDRGDYGTSVQQTFDGGYIITGYIGTNASGYYDVWLIKTNEFGDTTWTRKYGGSYSDYGYDVMQLADNGYVIAGNTSVIGGNYIDFFFIRTDSDGDTLWTKTYGGTGADRAYAVDTTSDGGFIIAGSTQSFGASQGGFYLIKTNSVGDTQWTAIYDNFEIDECRDVKPTGDGGYILAGFTRALGAGEYDMYLIKVNSNGDTLWTKKYGEFLDDQCYSIQVMSDGGFVFCGYHEPVTFHSQVLIIRTDADGNIIWEKKIGNSGGQYGNSIKKTSDGGFVLAGWKDSSSGTRQDLYIIKLEPESTPIYGYNPTEPITCYTLYPNYPNPFNPTTTITFNLPEASKVTLKIFNILGEEVTTLLSASLLSGSYSYEFDASDLASGVYLYRLEAGNYVETRKMVVMK
jgi:uncharacterized delta-60 repeat protein